MQYLAHSQFGEEQKRRALQVQYRLVASANPVPRSTSYAGWKTIASLPIDRLIEQGKCLVGLPLEGANAGDPPDWQHSVYTLFGRPAIWYPLYLYLPQQ